LETRTDSHGERQYSVRVIVQQEQRIVVSRAFHDAERIAKFPGIKRRKTKA
jgi:hypothetical protein